MPRNMKSKKFLVFLISLASLCLNGVLASTGDRSQMFHTCLQKCLAENCSETASFEMPIHLKFLLWTCNDDCKYNCMWPTVNWFIEVGIGAQQFFGKWPFIRFLGIQEPAATLFSLLNLASHIWMIKQFRKRVPPEAPYFLLVHLYCLVCVHAWFWSAVFHVRDLRFTEVMDYLCALSMVLFFFYYLLIRSADISNIVLSAVIALLFGIYLLYHSYTVFFIKMDYGYNMVINIGLGAISLLGWLIWYLKNKKILPHAKNCALFICLVAATTILEVWDFPPLFWVLDAHALWHLATSPLAFVWYRFLIDDCLYLYDKQLGYTKLA